jgi:hypothetical protein
MPPIGLAALATVTSRMTVAPKTPVAAPRRLDTRTAPDGLKFPPRTQFT